MVHHAARKYPSYQTCHRHFKAWRETGVLLNVMAHLFGPTGESLYALMTSRMRVPAELPFQVAAETYADMREVAVANADIGTRELQTPARRAA